MKKIQRYKILLFILCVLGILTLRVNSTTAQTTPTMDDLLRRIQILEARVSALEQRNAIASTQNSGQQTTVWTCKIIGRKDTFYGHGETQGLAESDAMEQCKLVSDVCKMKECSKQ